MNSERMDTDAPLNSNNNNIDDEEESNEDNKLPSKEDHKQEVNEKARSSQSSLNYGGRTSIEKFSQKSTQKIRIQRQQESQKNTNESQQRIHSQESISNNSQIQTKRDVQSQSIFNYNKQTKETIENRSNDKQSEQKYHHKSNKLIEEDLFQQIEEDQQEDQTTGSPPQKQRNNKLNHIQNIGRVENDLLLFESQGFTDNSERKNSKGDEKLQGQRQNENEQDFLEFDDIEIKRIEIPKPTNKKAQVQTIGIVRYMENSFLGKKKPSTEEQPSKVTSKNGSNYEQRDKNMLYLSFNQNQSGQHSEEFGIKEPVKIENNNNRDQKRKNENLFQKYPTSVSQYKQKRESQNSKFESNEDIKKNSRQLMNNSSKYEEKKSITSKIKSSQESQKNKFITFKKIKLVRRMIKIFEKYNIIRRFINIPTSYFRFFGDKASWFQSKSNDQSIFQKLKRQIDQSKKYNTFNSDQEEEISSKLVLFEDNKLVVLLKLLVIISSVMQCFYIPTSIAFSNNFEPTQNLNIIFTIIPNIIFIIDIYINFNLAFFLNGKLVANRRQIATNYFFGNYWFDFISIILQVTMDKSVPTLIYRIVVIKREMERILSTYQIQEKFYYAYRLIRLGIELILSCHILACTFILAASYSPQNNWIESNNLLHSTNNIIYLNGLYYIVVTIATIGYGDIHPVSNTEKLFLIFIAFVTSGLFAYNISTISSIVNDSIRKKLEVKRQILSITEYMTERNISRSIQNQILQQLYYNMRTEKRSPKVINECLKHVSENLKGSLFNEYFGNILSTNKYFKRKFSKQFLKSLLPKFKEEVFSPSEMLFQQGEQDQKLIYVRKGSVVLYLNYSNPTPIVQEFQEGKWLGFEEFFSGESKNCYAKSYDFTSIVYIERKDFLEVIQSFPKDKEKFCMIKDKIRFSNMSINYNCNICHSIFHQIQSCPYVHFAKKKEYIIQKYNYSLTSKREPFIHRRNYKYNSKMTNEQVRYQLKNFRMTLLLMAEGFNLFEYQCDLNECQSILENQKKHQGNQQYLSDEKFNQSKEFINQNMQSSNIAVQNSNQVLTSQMLQDGSQISCCDSPLPKFQLPESLQKNLSKFGENAVRVKQDGEESPNELNEIASPLSVRKTRHSFKNEEGSIEYRSVEPREINQQENQRKIESIHQQKSNSIHLNSQSQLREQDLDKGDEQQSFHSKNYQNIFIKPNTFDIKDEFQAKLRSKIFVERAAKKASTFVLKSQNMNSIIKILPTSIESDQEFFQKYDQIKWENNELQVIKGDNVASSASINQFDIINEGYVGSTTISNLNQLSMQRNVISSNFSQAQAQILVHNLSVINEETQKEDSASIVPIIATQPASSEQQILNKILSEVEQIKLQQDAIRTETSSKVSKIEAHITNALHRTFTFSSRSNNHTQEENIGNDQSARFFQNIDDISFGKRKTNEVENTHKNSDELVKEKIESTKRIQNEICPIQNDSQPFSFQNEKNFSQNTSNVNEEITNSNKIQPTATKFDIPIIPYTPQINANSNNNNTEVLMQRRMSKFNQQSIYNQFLNQDVQQILSSQPQQYYFNKSTYVNPVTRLKDKIEIQFFLAFERQNNWKTYFPTQNLSYLTDKMIKSQKRRLKIETIPPLKMVESTVQPQRTTSKFRRLSQLVQENRERNGINSVNSFIPRKQSIKSNKRVSINIGIFQKH